MQDPYLNNILSKGMVQALRRVQFSSGRCSGGGSLPSRLYPGGEKKVGLVVSGHAPHAKLCLVQGAREICYRLAVQITHQVFVKVELLLVVCRRFKLRTSPLSRV